VKRLTLTMKLFDSISDMNAFVKTHDEWIDYIDVKIVPQGTDNRYNCTQYLFIYHAIDY
jgi:hypothetical protein